MGWRRFYKLFDSLNAKAMGLGEKMEGKKTRKEKNKEMEKKL